MYTNSAIQIEGHSQTTMMTFRSVLEEIIRNLAKIAFSYVYDSKFDRFMFHLNVEHRKKSCKSRAGAILMQWVRCIGSFCFLGYDLKLICYQIAAPPDFINFVQP